MSETQIFSPSEDWPTVRANPKFIEVMRIARVANCLSLGYSALATDGSDDSPTARRERFASLFYTAALLKEGLDTARSLGRWCRDMPEYQAGFGTLLSDPEVARFRDGLLDQVRDQLVFHFDRDAVADGLKRLPDGEMILGSYPPGAATFKDTYFDVADASVLGCLFGDTTDDEVYLGRLREFMSGVGNLMTRFVPAAHRLVVASLIEFGCKQRTVVRAPHPLDAE